ncbi:MAG: glutaredoxin family protein [Anaerolineales bacterium]
MLTLILYGKNGCHICAEVKAHLLELEKEYPINLLEIDIEQNQDLRERFEKEIPVIEIGPYTLKAPIQRKDLEVTIAAAIDRKQQLEDLQDPNYLQNLKRGAQWSTADKIALWISRHYLFMINIVVLLYLGIPFLAPVLMKMNVQTPAKVIYRAYGLVCHQLGYRSFYLFGSQLTYPRQAAGIKNLLSFHQATGLSEENSNEAIFAARAFLGNPQVGYKIALCQRDIAIYSGILFFGILFALVKRKIPALPWYLWVLIGLIPIGLDGVSQLISQPPFSLIPYRESTPLLRVVTGLLFGFTTAWFGFPSVEESMAETRRILGAKQLRLMTQIKNFGTISQ